MFFNNMNIGNNGVLECNFYIHGKKTQVVIDDYFPFKEIILKDKEMKQPKLELMYANFNPKHNNLWAVILEKCWAKLNGSYHAIAKGMVSDAFEVLFPFPVETYPNHIYGQERLWEIIEEADNEKYMLCADISGDEDDPFFKAYPTLGLVSGHAYTLIGCQ